MNNTFNKYVLILCQMYTYMFNEHYRELIRERPVEGQRNHSLYEHVHIKIDNKQEMSNDTYAPLVSLVKTWFW